MSKSDEFWNGVDRVMDNIRGNTAPCEVCEQKKVLRRVEIEKDGGRKFWLDLCDQCALWMVGVLP